MIRIIAGKWRGRKINVPSLLSVRPTPNRVRETLFNWLNPIIYNAYCLDAFSGSGALGLEALSRGALKVVMTDTSSAVIAYLKKTALELQAENLTIYRASLPGGLQSSLKPFDIVFLDPPYHKNLLLPVSKYLEEGNFLAAKANIYMENNKPLEANWLPKNWQIIKSKKAASVFYYLILREKI